MDTAGSAFPLLGFLLRAKRSTYAASDDPVLAAAAAYPSSRPGSHDLAYREGDLFYLDTYLGGFSFAGQEAVWRGQEPLWAMNYYGSMMVPSIPEGFSAFLKQALRQPPEDAPYRGPRRFSQGSFEYTCRSEGSPAFFQGEERITLDGQEVYFLHFHGGDIA